MERYLDTSLSAALIEAWNPSEKGAEALADVLVGAYNPCGKLPVSTAYHAGQIPVYYNHPNGSAWHQGESIGFANYVDMPHTPRYFFGYGLSYTSMTRPAMELAGFTRVELGQGEAKQVIFEVNPSQLAFLDRKMKWKIEVGMIQVMVGASYTKASKNAA